MLSYPRAVSCVRLICITFVFWCTFVDSFARLGFSQRQQTKKKGGCFGFLYTDRQSDSYSGKQDGIWEAFRVTYLLDLLFVFDSWFVSCVNISFCVIEQAVDLLL
ncbi:hypothetical protein BJY04DRAFT_154504 [Aspergillus karnatakaensis]|uniref:uncharacterized protein n=1 Tax=Aspergillus karnatakaensis TaxID=1810916 RepID=UPI003CCE4411